MMYINNFKKLFFLGFSYCSFSCKYILTDEFYSDNYLKTGFLHGEICL